MASCGVRERGTCEHAWMHHMLQNLFVCLHRVDFASSRTIINLSFAVLSNQSGRPATPLNVYEYGMRVIM